MSSSTIKVICRFRPLNKTELALQNSIGNNNANQLSLAVNVNPDQKSVTTKDNDDFTFDRVFDVDSSQQDVFLYSIKQTVSDVMNGYNGTVLAYGQTGSGKTFTMMGPDLENDKQMGIIPRIVYSIFEHIVNSPSETEYTVSVSFLEIYKERIKDLLNVSNDNLHIHEDKSRGIYVKGLLELYVNSTEEIFEIMKLGNTMRSVAETKMNIESSRSHSIFIININQKHIIKGTTTKGKLYLVDLAGSEKVSKTGATGQTLEEAKNINKSLSSLGLVINALLEPKNTHIPYRNSKLTRILQESLGGNSRTTLIINCSPSIYNYSETLSTLRFGERAKKIKNNAKINQELSQEQLKVLVKSLRKKLNGLKENYSLLTNEIMIWRSGKTVERKEYTKIMGEESKIPKLDLMSDDNSSIMDNREYENISQLSYDTSKLTILSENSENITNNNPMINNLIKHNQLLSIKVAELNLINGKLENELEDLRQQEKNAEIQKYIDQQSNMILNLDKFTECRKSALSTVSETLYYNENIDKSFFDEDNININSSYYENHFEDKNLENLKYRTERLYSENNLMKNFIQILQTQIEHYQKKEKLSLEYYNMAEEEYSRVVKNLFEDRKDDGSSLKTRMEQYQAQIISQTDEINNLKTKNEQLINQNYELTKVNNEIINKNKKLEIKGNTLSKQVDLLSSKTKTDQLKKQLLTQAEESKRQVMVLEQALKEKYEKITELETTLNTAKNEYMILLSNNKQYDVYKKNMEQVKERFELLFGKQSQLIEEYMQLKKDKIMLAQKVKYKDEKIELLLNKNNEMQTHIDKLNDKLIIQTELDDKDSNNINSALKHVFPLLSRYSPRIIKPLRGQSHS